MTCSCGRIMLGSKATESRNWNPDCLEHGLASDWWLSPEQIEKRRQQNERLKTLQAQARDARKLATEKAVHSFKEVEPGVYETTIDLITPCPFHEEDYWGACPCDEGDLNV